VRIDDIPTINNAFGEDLDTSAIFENIDPYTHEYHPWGPATT
jgi:hypothetical protein